MAKYHLNWKGEAGVCRAKKNCPFGDLETEHFSSPSEARQAFEARHGSPVGPSVKKNARVEPNKPKASPRPPQTKASPAASWEDFTPVAPEDSKLIVAPRENDPSGGYMGGRLWVGGKVPTTGYLSQKEAAKNIRSDIKQAVKLGELPEDLSYSVRMNSGSMVSSISIILGTKDAAGRPSEFTEDAQSSPKLKQISSYLESLGKQYSSEDINGMVDYFNSSNGVRVRLRHKWD